MTYATPSAPLLDDVVVLRRAHDSARWHVDGALSSLLARCTWALMPLGFELRSQSGPSCTHEPGGAFSETTQTAQVRDSGNGALYELGGILTSRPFPGGVEHRLQTYTRGLGRAMAHLEVHRTYTKAEHCDDREDEALLSLGKGLESAESGERMVAAVHQSSIP